MSRPCEPPPCVDVAAEGDILASLLQMYGKREWFDLTADDFWLEAHQTLWAYAGRLRWPEIRRKLGGDGDALDLFWDALQTRAPCTKEQLVLKAERVKELGERRRLIALMRKLEIELTHDLADVSDAGDELQRYLLKEGLDEGMVA